MKRSILCLVVALAPNIAGCGDSDAPLTLPQPMPGTSPVTYPTDLWDLGVNGETMLMVRITERGTVDSVYVLEPSDHVEFDSAAVRGARLLRFAPGRRGDRPIPLWTRLPIRFRRDSVDIGEAEPVGPDSMGGGS